MQDVYEVKAKSAPPNPARSRWDLNQECLINFCPEPGRTLEPYKALFVLLFVCRQGVSQCWMCRYVWRLAMVSL